MSEEEKAVKQKKRKKLFLELLFVAVVVLLAYFMLRGSWESIWLELRHTSWQVIVSVLLCSVLYNCFDGIAVAKLVRRENPDFAYYKGILCSFYYSFFRVITFGGGTAAAGMYYVSRDKIPVTRSLGIFTLNYTIQRITVCLYFIISFFINYRAMHGYYASYTKTMILGVALAFVVAAVLILACTSERLHHVVFSAAGRWIHKKKYIDKLQKLKEKSALVREEARQILKNKKLLAQVLFLNVLKLSAWYLIPVLTFHETGDSQETALIMSVTAMVVALAGVIPAPGGIGAVEFVFTLFFTPVAGRVASASGMLIYRFSTYIFPCLLGLAVVIRTQLIKKKRKR